MRTWCYPCLLVIGLFVPRPCLAQAAADKARSEQEMQEDVEVLRRIVTESVQQLYQRADERVTRSCAACHQIETPRDAAPMLQGFDPHLFDGSYRPWTTADLEAVHAGGWKLSRNKQPTEQIRVSGLANYLPGQGIVVQLEAPAPVVDRDVKAFVEAEEAAPKRWESLLHEMHGDAEKNPPLKPLVVPPQHRRVHRLILTEKAVDLLAENGRNLRQLAPEERVTIAFTFRTPSREQIAAERATLLRHYFPNASGGARVGMAAPVPDGGGVLLGGNGNRKAVGGGPRGGGARAVGAEGAADEGSAGESPSARTSAVAGDLLLRQGRYAEAVVAYEKALRESGVTLDTKTPLPADAADLVRKLVQAHVGAKHMSQATDLLQWLERSQASSSDETTALRRIYLDLTGVPPTPEDVKTYLNDARPNRREMLLERLLADAQGDDGPWRVPARMTISCTRQQLDDVAKGKLTKLDFASKVSLKYYKPSGPVGKKDVMGVTR
jgi:Protein of unknown function (DUF1549)